MMVNVERVQNGYIVVLDAEFEEEADVQTCVAKDLDEVHEIMRQYFEGDA